MAGRGLTMDALHIDEEMQKELGEIFDSFRSQSSRGGREGASPTRTGIRVPQAARRQLDVRSGGRRLPARRLCGHARRARHR